MSDAFFSCIPLTTTSLNFSEGAKSLFAFIQYLWLDESKLQKVLYKILAKTLFIGKKVVFLPSCHSTNMVASEMLKKTNLQEGAIVITNDQTNGVGQRGNVWEANPNQNLTFTIVLKPKFIQASNQFELNMMISLGVIDYLNHMLKGFLVKWPNDIYYEDKKVGGILIQNTIKKDSIENSVIGIGLNINQPTFSYPKAVSLLNIMNRSFDLQLMLENVCQHIEARYLQLRQGKSLKAEYLSLMLGYKKKWMFRSNIEFEGVIQDIDKIGRLVVEGHPDQEYFQFKEIQFL